ncbi:diguanylate cyclase/phosphodiesterase with PAS/PAC sensor(s) [Persephonella hydrogeniphila]|uniref:Diguanylate cyclase/phosphodiesterase with PAS/PAC sensor(S) n=1 Tax=Persephonella hydrogeniphila TaxID=198703 RepID=A0A285N3L8_9AQUI|nr:EAL domain-containing protein [Persephonella hydrogeniphila]SNZ03533.1 diguanylate cyclase/phosphodiesterase with PAS/PAC sensor(s) [Persephonella hydrogeniphila]
MEKKSFFIIDKELNILYLNRYARNIYGNKTGEKCFRLLRKENKPCSICPVTSQENLVLFEKEKCINALNCKEKTLYKILRNLNEAAALSISEEDVLKKFCSVLSEELGNPYILVAIKDGKAIKPIECGGIENIEPVITEDIEIIHQPEGRYRSVACIPVYKKDRLFGIINLFSEKTEIFDTKDIYLFREIKKDIEASLNNLESIKESIVLKEAIEKSNEWVIITDKEGKIIYANKTVLEISGYTKEEILYRNLRVFKSGMHSKEFYKELWETILAGKEFEGTFINRRKDGNLFYLKQKIIPVKIDEKNFRFLAIGKDITEELRLAKENEYLRFYDQLTGLLNFEGFVKNISAYIEKSKRTSALIIIDISDFTYLNKVYGIEAGRIILKSVAKRIKNRFRKRDILGKTGSDEFAILLTDLKNKEDVFIIENKIRDIFEKNFNIKGKEIKIHFNAGISIYPDDAEDIHKLYENASLSLNNAKKEGADTVRFFNKDIEEKAKNILNSKILVEKAFRHNCFKLYYQPYFDAKDLSVAGFESLARIVDKKGNIYLPSYFIDYLENSPYIEQFTEWAFDQVSRKINRWGVPVSINISGKLFKNTKLINMIHKHSNRLKKFLILEITERVFIEDINRGNNLLKKLKFIPNLKISIDDFGTGYSAFSYIKDMDADIIKIDISFTKAVVKDKKSRAIVEGIIHITKSLGIKTVAEGVETKEQMEILRKMGVDYLQGFYLSKPVDEKEVEQKFIKHL